MQGYGVYQAGIATHFVPSAQLAALEERLAALDFTAEEPSTSAKGYQKINACIEEFVADANSVQGKPYALVGLQRKAIDACFGAARAEEVMSALIKVEDGSHRLLSDPGLKEAEVVAVKKWAKETRTTLELRSPTSVKVALEGIRLGSKMTIDEVFDLDIQLASVCCVSVCTRHTVTVACFCDGAHWFLLVRNTSLANRTQTWRQTLSLESLISW